MKNGRNSPYAALTKAKKEGLEVNISLKTFYNYIHGRLFLEYRISDMIYKTGEIE